MRQSSRYNFFIKSWLENCEWSDVNYISCCMYIISSGSEVTCFYLKLMRLITASYLDKSLSPLDRIYGIWYSCLALRYWRHWLQENGYKLDINFITLNAYMCVEINAHALVLISRRLRENGTPRLFRTWHLKLKWH